MLTRDFRMCLKVPPGVTLQPTWEVYDSRTMGCLSDPVHMEQLPEQMFID